MSKRTKANVKYWEGKIDKLFATVPISQLTEHRFQAVRGTLTGQYPWIETIDKPEFIRMLADADYVARKMRLKTEGIQKDLKKQLSQEFIVTNL